MNALINFVATVNPRKKQRDPSFQFLKYNDVLFERKFIEIKILEREKQIVFFLPPSISNLFDVKCSNGFDRSIKCASY